MKDFKWKWQDSVIVILGLVAVGYALLNYNRLPEQLPVHYGINGEPDNYWSKGAVISLMGAFGILLPLLMQFTRSIDPKRENYKKFENAYGMTRLVIGVFFNLMLMFTISSGLGENLDAGKLGLAAAGLMFIFMGNYMPQVKGTYLFGIRTAWTLASPEVWRKTHRTAGILWVAAGLLILVGALLGKTWSASLLIAALILAIVVPTLYSWAISRRLEA
ncbi:hypothetical protein GCM10010912_64890 [Paenibacillus albidus]|uniref:DUF1648 domain-containing protein n=1 Tax=Paenibacillus albidus TaxID=2041023 RepID=A0A917D5F7_9BACL|nr:SdpI family protein [Paenibacillus albidus]GGG11517.1 hypothetical protein GCM10010912_64890 [Paenibacillus albidus]